MLEVLRAGLRRRRGLVAVVCTAALLGTVAAAHGNLADDHMGEAAAMCLGIVVGGAAVAALPVLRSRPTTRGAAFGLRRGNASLELKFSAPHLARGDPAVLQVFRR